MWLKFRGIQRFLLFNKPILLSDFARWLYSGRFLFLLTVIILLFNPACKEKEKASPEEYSEITLVGRDSRLALSAPFWSPDGNLLVVSGTYLCGMNPCENEIFTLNVATRELHPFGGKGLSGATWTNNHREISYLNGGPSDIYTANLDDGSAQYFVDGQRVAWSSDGNYVAIVRKDRNAELGLSRSVVFIRDISAGGQEKIVFETPKSMSNDITGLAWSFDSTRLVLSARWSVGENHESGLYVFNMVGYGLRQLAENIEQPGWMPGGSWLFFIREGKLGFAPIDFACTLTPLSFENLNAPTISPMGSSIAFEYEHSIYLVNLDQVLGKNREKLVCPD